MKKRNDKILIEDILLAINNILEFTGQKDFENFSSDEMLVSAIERKFEIIGEAAGKISLELKEKTKHIPWHKVISIRNIIIHGYFTVDREILFFTIQNDIQPLKEKLVKILNAF